MTQQTTPPSLEGDIENQNPNAHLNRLRAAVLGANDGIVSTAGIIVGVAGVTDNKSIILTAGLAGVLAGALSMAVGEYVSVSTQRDTEKALLDRERQALLDHPDEELLELAQIYVGKGLQPETALTVANELTQNDAFAAHADAEFGMDPNSFANPWHAAIASALSFVAGSVIPILAMLLPLGHSSVPMTFISVVAALLLVGYVSARASRADILTAMRRVVLGGITAMVVTYTMGSLLHGAGL